MRAHLRGLPPGRMDVAVALCLTLGGLAWAWDGVADPGPRGLATAAVIGLGAALAVRRRAPLALAGTFCVVALAEAAADTPLTSLWAFIALLYTAYSIGAHTEQRDSLIGLGLVLAGVWPNQLIDPTSSTSDRIFAPFIIALGPWLAGRLVRNHRTQSAKLASLNAELESRRALDLRQAVTEERARIARELHDVIAHSLSVMVIQAGGAEGLAPAGPVGDALHSIRRTGKSALTEMRRLLDVTRADGEELDLEPQPGVHELTGDRRADAGGRHAGPPRPRSRNPGAAAGTRPRRLPHLPRSPDQHPQACRADRRARPSQTQRPGHRDRSHRQRRPRPSRRRRPGARPARDARAPGALRRRAVQRTDRRRRLAHSGAPPTPRRGPAVIRTLIADDQALVRGGFRMILEAQPDIEVVAEAADGRQALEAARLHRPDVVLMDIRMPGLDGIQATRRLLAAGSGPKVMMLTTFGLDEHVYDALHAGASGFLLKDVDPPELVRAVRVIHSGEALLAPTITRRLIEQHVARPAPGAGTAELLAALSARELEVLRGLARGLTNAEIAAELHLSPATVKTHVARILDKLDLRDRIQAVVLAYETGLVTPRA